MRIFIIFGTSALARECKTENGDYYGKINVTKSGKTCRKWAEIQDPLIDDENYCRYNLSFKTIVI